MKKKGTRKVRKNRRTQRRKNRSYKQMKGGLWWLGSDRAPLNVDAKNIIIEVVYKSFAKNPDLLWREYNKARSKTNWDDIYKSEITTQMSTLITPELKKWLPIYKKNETNNNIAKLIETLIRERFLPADKAAFTTLLDNFYREIDTTHKKPNKYNGIALAVFLAQKSFDLDSKRPVVATPSPPPRPPPPDTTNKPQKYIFVFDPQSVTSWDQLKTSIPPNSICHERQRIRMCTSGYGGPHPFGEQPTDRSLATYNKFHIVDGEPLAPEVIHKIHTGDKLIIDQLDLSKYDKTIISDNRLRGGEYKFYRIVKHRQNIDFTNIRNPKLCRNKIYIPVDKTTVYEYDEDGIINCVLTTFTHLPVVVREEVHDICRVDYETPSQAVYIEIIESMENELKLGLNPRRVDIHKLHELEPLIEIPMIIDRSAVTSGAAADDRYTLVMSSPGRWDIFTATRIQTAAFNRVKQYLIESRITIYDMLQIKRFRVSNGLEGAANVTVIIEVKEMNPYGTLKRAICMGDTLSEFELLDTELAAHDRKRAKEANYSQVTSSGPGYGY